MTVSLPSRRWRRRCYALVQAIRSRGEEQRPPATAGRRTGQLVVTGIALSIDNLAVGFALGTYHVGIVVAAVTMGVVSVAMSLLGLELGDRLGARTGEWGELLGGLVLIAVGVTLAVAGGIL